MLYGLASGSKCAKNQACYVYARLIALKMDVSFSCLCTARYLFSCTTRTISHSRHCPRLPWLAFVRYVQPLPDRCSTMKKENPQKHHQQRKVRSTDAGDAYKREILSRNEDDQTMLTGFHGDRGVRKKVPYLLSSLKYDSCQVSHQLSPLPLLPDFSAPARNRDRQKNIYNRLFENYTRVQGPVHRTSHILTSIMQRKSPMIEVELTILLMMP